MLGWRGRGGVWTTGGQARRVGCRARRVGVQVGVAVVRTGMVAVGVLVGKGEGWGLWWAGLRVVGLVGVRAREAQLAVAWASVCRGWVLAGWGRD